MKSSRRQVLSYGALAGASGAVSLTPGLAEAATSSAATNRLPVIPQLDTLAGRLARAAALQSQRFQYLWTTQTPTIPGVPLAVGVPLDELPTLEWLLLAMERVVELVINFVDSILAQFSAALAADIRPIRDDLVAVRSSVAATRVAFDAIVAAQGARAGVDSLTAIRLAALRATLDTGMGRLGAIRQQLTGLVAADLKNTAGIGDLGSTDGLGRYTAMWSTLPIPDVATNVHDDHVFAQLRVAGANPMSLTRVRGALPAKLPLGSTAFAQVMNEPLETAIAAGRVYLADYVQLGSLAPRDATYKFLTGTGYNSAPIALFAVPESGGPLQAVAIQCGQDPSTAPLVLRPAPDDSEHYWGWQMAKTVVQTADFNFHEMFVHLGRTHLVSEAFAVATHRHLASVHPLNVLLLPHFEGDIFINALAALLIMGRQTFGDIILAGPVETAQAAAGRARLDWDFYAHMPPTEFAARGVADTTALPEYPYRDDALRVWDALRTWVVEYLGVYYASDAAVVGDTELAAWVRELATVGKVRGFRTITTRAQLADVVTMIIFTASAQHAAVNYPQADLMTYAPFSAGAMAAPPPTTSSGHVEADWVKMLPSVFGALAQMYFLNLLGGVHYRPLGDYRGNDFPYLPALTDPRVAGPDGPLARHHASLVSVEEAIERANANRSLPYEYLLPSKIPMSTNI